MKRFYCALVLLFIIIASSLYLNNKVEQKADELISVVRENNDSQKIYLWWEENSVWFESILPEELTKNIYTNVYKLNENLDDAQTNEAIVNIEIGAQKIKESIKFSVENIF